MTRVKIIVGIWVLLITFGAGFACSRIHDSERVARMWEEARKARDEYRQFLMDLEKLPTTENPCKRDGNIIRCSSGAWWHLDWETRKYGGK